ncbi:unnamed protein product [Echinostoma caproni]|uniref:Uncharacterized protein n=1 Tax=Echinostoma caproni TaxID=27848 RepID=A0A183AER8_9TREM|nr:unnamed protein product [Echinostoma caproni]
MVVPHRRPWPQGMHVVMRRPPSGAVSNADNIPDPFGFSVLTTLHSSLRAAIEKSLFDRIVAHCSTLKLQIGSDGLTVVLNSRLHPGPILRRINGPRSAVCLVDVYHDYS